MSRFLTGLHMVELHNAYGAQFKLRGYPGSWRSWKGRAELVDGIPFDYEEYKNNERTKGPSSGPAKP